MNYIVSFDINKETNPNYKATHKNLTDLLRALKGKRINFSVWMISSPFGPRLLYRFLERQLDSDDSLVISLCPASFFMAKNPLEDPAISPFWLQRLVRRQAQRGIRRRFIPRI